MSIPGLLVLEWKVELTIKPSLLVFCLIHRIPVGLIIQSGYLEQCQECCSADSNGVYLVLDGVLCCDSCSEVSGIFGPGRMVSKSVALCAISTLTSVQQAGRGLHMMEPKDRGSKCSTGTMWSVYPSFTVLFERSDSDIQTSLKASCLIFTQSLLSSMSILCCFPHVLLFFWTLLFYAGRFPNFSRWFSEVFSCQIDHLLVHSSGSCRLPHH